MPTPAAPQFGGNAASDSAESAAPIVGVDLGGGTLRMQVFDAAGVPVSALLRVATPPEGEPVALAGALRAGCDALRAEGATWLSAGVALPGLLDRAAGVLRRAVNLPRLEGVELDPLFADALGMRPIFDTDVIAAGWAQFQRLAPMPPQAARLAYLSIGTGIGGCVMLGGQLVRHTRDGAGQLGHLIVDSTPQAPRCRCGGRGCVEAVWQSRPAAAPAALALACVQIARVYAPDRIVLGGGAVDHGAINPAAVQAAFDARRDSLMPADLRIEAAPLTSDEAGVWGAAALARAALRI